MGKVWCKNPGSWYKPRMEPLPSDDLYKERYTVEKKIGQGGFGKVFLVKEKDGETCYAAKCIKARGRKEKERGRREVEMLKNLDSNFVIRLVDAFEGRSEVIHCASHILLIKESISV